MNLTAQKRYREWAAQIDAQQSSGLTQREWCRVHGITYEAFKYRKGRLETDMLPSSRTLKQKTYLGVFL